MSEKEIKSAVENEDVEYTEQSIEEINASVLQSMNKKNTYLIIGTILVLMLMMFVKYGVGRTSVVGGICLFIVGVSIYIANCIIKNGVKKAVTIFLMGGVAANIYSFLVGGTPIAFTVAFVLLGMSAMYFNVKITVFSTAPLGIFMLALSIVCPHVIDGKGATIAEAVAKVVIYGVSVILIKEAITYGEKINIDSYVGLVKVKENRNKSKELARELNDTVAQSNESIKGLIEESKNIDKTVIGVSEDNDKSKNNIDIINKSVVFVGEYIDKNRELSEQLKKKFNDVVDSVNSGLDKTKVTESVITSMGDKIQESAVVSEELLENMQSVTEILEEIDDIFSQTRLLALNASIEAARAGERGQGFEVVADEIRNLSSQSSKASSNIKSTIETLNVTIDEVVSNIKNGIKVSEQGNREINVIADILQRINTTSKNIDSIINDENKLISYINNEFNEISDDIVNVSELSKNNDEKIKDIQTSIELQNNSVLELGQKMEYVVSLASDIN